MNNLFQGIYKGKKVLLTGSTGFKGSWLVLLLKKLGASVYGYSLNPNTTPNMFSECNINSIIDKQVIGDIKDSELLNKVVCECKPDIIFHLAAQPLVRLSYEQPKDTYETNVIGTLNVYEAVRKSKCVKAIVSITTDKCYENKEWEYGYREIDPMGGYDPYSSSKGCVELLSNSYRRSFYEKEGILLATARAGNVIGGGDWAKDRLIPDFVRAIDKNEKINIRNPLAIRPWQHVLEPLYGYLTLGAELLKGNEDIASAWNFGPNDLNVLSVKEVLDKCIGIFGRGGYKIDDSNQPHEALLLKLDISKAKSILKWKPILDVDKAIEMTIDWYKYFYNKEGNILNYTNNQINYYLEHINL